MQSRNIYKPISEGTFSSAFTTGVSEQIDFSDLALQASSSSKSNKSSSTFTRTKLCSFHLRGMCSHGTSCSYAHEMVELRDQPDLSKTRMCPMFRKGNCSRTNCTYAHSRDELRGTDDVYKTSLCRFWANGKCAAGKYCRHAHGIEELRIRPVRDGGVSEETAAPTVTALSLSSVSEPTSLSSDDCAATTASSQAGTSHNTPSTPTVIPLELLEELLHSTTELIKFHHTL